jgi:hypothetical protein
MLHDTAVSAGGVVAFPARVVDGAAADIHLGFDIPV